MPYNKRIPQPKDKKSDSQLDIKDNFTSINDSFSVDHVEFNDTNQGKHNKVILRVLENDPETVSDESCVFCKKNDEGLASLYFRDEGNADVVSLFSGGSSEDSVNDSVGLGPDGWSALPGGLLLKWGKWAGVSFTNATSTVVKSFPTGADIPVFTDIYSVKLSTSSSRSESSDTKLKQHNNTSLSIYVQTNNNRSVVSDITYFVVGAY